ncbi:MAG: Tim44/TimA family putative adaptor protein [Pseudomonadota bacterium]
MKSLMLDLELIIFAAVAVFVLSRLYAVLGRKTGAEPPPQILQEGAARRNAPDPEPRPAVRPAFTGPAAAGMEAIAGVDAMFDPDGFSRGAKAAYEMIVNAFADGDRDTLGDLLTEEVYEAYDDAISTRDEDEHEPLRLMRLKSAEIIDAELTNDGMARVSVSFDAELSDGENLRAAKEIWTFERLAESDDPNWRLAEVETAS